MCQLPIDPGEAVQGLGPLLHLAGLDSAAGVDCGGAPGLGLLGQGAPPAGAGRHLQGSVFGLSLKSQSEI